MIKKVIEDIIGQQVTPIENIDWYNGDYNSTIFYNYDMSLIFCLFEEHGHFVIGIDNKSVFNKYSQCPIFFDFTWEKPRLSQRRQESLLRALKYLETKEGAEESATFEFPDFGGDLTREYCENNN